MTRVLAFLCRLLGGTPERRRVVWHIDADR